MEENSNLPVLVIAKSDRKVIKAPATKVLNRIPADILENALLNEDIKILPSNYNFEIHKTIWRVRETGAKKVGLQMPEGLLLFATTIADIVEKYTECKETVIMGDVTYGACCVDDFTAKALRVDLLVHYGHSCLIPVDRTSSTKALYIFVDIKIDALHFMETIKLNFDISKRLGFVSTIQFVATLQGVATELRKDGWTIIIPQAKPLSPGEILGCTSPRISGVDALIYLGDGRFHLESAMIANPDIPAYRYDPYDKQFTQQYYEHAAMLKVRSDSVKKCINAGTFGLILGTLGRQGSPLVLQNLQERMTANKKNAVVVLLSEIFPGKLEMFGKAAEAWIQVACPRLSIDWGAAFSSPLLTPYECASAMAGDTTLTHDGIYPMDYYAVNSRGDWTPKHKHSECECGKKEKCQQ